EGDGDDARVGRSGRQLLKDVRLHVYSVLRGERLQVGGQSAAQAGQQLPVSGDDALDGGVKAPRVLQGVETFQHRTGLVAPAGAESVDEVLSDDGGRRLLSVLCCFNALVPVSRPACLRAKVAPWAG